MRRKSERTLLSLVNRECDTLRGFLLFLEENGEFSKVESEKIMSAVYAIDSASVILSAHMNGVWIADNKEN